MHKPELLSPVQDFTSLTAAIQGGADAVYFGIKGVNMRENAKNFSVGELPKVVKVCHAHRIKAYLALNIIIYDEELKKVTAILQKAKKAGIDAIICWDFAVIEAAQKLGLAIDISTQASLSNYAAIKSLKQRYPGIRRVVLARELTLAQIQKIIKKIHAEKLGVDIETFIHGAMCVSISGRCFMSNDLFGASANRGNCYQPCRRKYVLKDIEEGYELELGSDYVMSPKDMCALPFIEKLVKAGIRSFKIEGRNRSPEYVKVVTEVYREAIDNPAANRKNLYQRLKTVYNRDFSSGFYMGKPIGQWTTDPDSHATQSKRYIGKVMNYYAQKKAAEVLLEAHGIKVGDLVMFQGSKTGVCEQRISSLQQHKKSIDAAAQGASVAMHTQFPVRKNDKVFIISQK